MYLSVENNKRDLVHHYLFFLSLLFVMIFFYFLMERLNRVTISTDKKVSRVVQEKYFSVLLTQYPIVEKVKVKKSKPVIKKVIPKKIKKIVKRLQKSVPKQIVEPVIKAVERPVVKPTKTNNTVVKKIVTFDADIKTMFIDGLYEILDKKKTYPKMAKRRHLEGVSYVSFTLCKDGAIKNILISKSSGHKLLDKAALKLVQSIKSYKAIPEAVSRVSLNLEIPIKYKRS